MMLSAACKTPHILDPDYAAVLLRAYALGYAVPTSAQKIKHSILVKALKAAGIWTKLDVFWLFLNNGSAEFSTLNWKNPNTYQCTLVNSPTWTSNKGFLPNGSSSLVETNFNVTGGVNYTQNNASRGVWVTTNTTVGLPNILGSNTSSRDALVNDGTSTAQRINQSTTSTTAMANFGNTGLLSLNRISTVASTHFAGLTSYARTPSSQAIVSDTITLGKVNTSYGSVEVGMLYMGASLVGEHIDLYNAVTNYMAAP